MHSENNELAKAGRDLAKCLDSNTPLTEIAKLIARLATALDVTTLAVREATKQLDQVAQAVGWVEGGNFTLAETVGGHVSGLKAAAEKARWGDWSAYKPHKGARGYEVRVGCEAVAQHCLKDDADFIAEASPKVVLELIASLEAKDAQIAELEHVKGAAEKLVRCKGRYHSEQNYRALAALFGVKTPDLPPLPGESDINLETGGE